MQDSASLDAMDPVERLIEVLSLEHEDGAPANEECFVGPSHWMPHGRVFGGQILAQALVAATRTVDTDRFVHSMHAYFLRAGDVRLPVGFSVEQLRNGRSFSARRVLAYQNGKPILAATCSFQTLDVGVEHQQDIDVPVPPPESLPSTQELLKGQPAIVQRAFETHRAFEMRHYPSPVYLTADGERVAHQAVWVKAVGTLPDDPALHRAALAYLSDYTILEPIMRRHGLAWVHPGMRTASLDHAMWFHRYARVDDWLLYLQRSPSAQGGRGLSFGSIYSRTGALIASVAQEGMIRIPEIGGTEPHASEG